jgi:pyruvate kinase
MMIKARSDRAMAAVGFNVSAADYGESQSSFLSARLVADRLGVTLAELARLIGVARAAFEQCNNELTAF